MEDDEYGYASDMKASDGIYFETQAQRGERVSHFKINTIACLGVDSSSDQVGR